MSQRLHRAAPLLAAAALLLLPVGVCAQPPAPPPPPAEEQPAEPVEPVDDGPQAAGVGSAQPPRPESETVADDPAPEVVDPRANLPSGVPESGTQPSSRPFTGLFGGAGPPRSDRHSLTVTGSVYGSYYKNVALGPVDRAGDASDPFANLDSLVAGGSATAQYSHNWDRASFGAYATGTRAWAEQYSQSDDDPWITRWEAGVNGGFTKSLSRRVLFRTSGTATHSPYLQLGGQLGFLSGGLVAPPLAGVGADFTLAYDPSLLIRTDGALSVSMTRRSSVELYYAATFQTFLAANPLNSDRDDQFGGIRYQHRFGRYLGVHAGYGYRGGSQGTDDTRRNNHYVDVGVDSGYGRSYALTRRTTFSFSTSTSLFVNQDLDQTDEAFDPQTRLFLGGSADLTHTMGRSWAAQLSYRRAVSYVVGFTDPVLTNTAIASLSGLLAPRLDFSAAVSYTSGAVGFGSGDNGLASASSVVRLRYALSRHLATYAQYFYYHYLFDSGVQLPQYLRPELDRQGVSVGLTTWLPLIGPRGRR